MSELNNAVNSQIISKHIKLDVERTNLEEVLREVALTFTEYENKILDLEHKIAEKDRGGRMIQIKKSKTADSITCDFSKVTKDQLLQSSNQHISDIRKGFEFFRNIMLERAILHDYSKITHIDDFHRNFLTGFKETDWWVYHQKVERHHFNDAEFIQEDVNLIDIIDQIIDGVMAGLARSGEYRQENISPELLQKAYNNTVNLLLCNVEVED